jgi:transposase
MKPPLYVRALADAGGTALRQGLRSPVAFTLRRCQILLHSADGLPPARIAQSLSCAKQTVRDAIRAFHTLGLACLDPKSHAPKTTHAVWPRQRDEDLKVLLHQSPRTHGQPTGLWTLALVASVCHRKGWTARLLSDEAIRHVLRRLGISWKRAKHWIHSPDPDYAAQKKSATA